MHFHEWNMFFFISKITEHQLSRNPFYFRFGTGNSTQSALTLTPDRRHVQCTGATNHLCGKNGVPPKETPSPDILITGAKLVPRAHSAKTNQWQRNKYTWKVTRYNVKGRMGYCGEKGRLYIARLISFPQRTQKRVPHISPVRTSMWCSSEFIVWKNQHFFFVLCLISCLYSTAVYR